MVHLTLLLTIASDHAVNCFSSGRRSYCIDMGVVQCQRHSIRSTCSQADAPVDLSPKRSRSDHAGEPCGYADKWRAPKTACAPRRRIGARFRDRRIHGSVQRGEGSPKLKSQNAFDPSQPSLLLFSSGGRGPSQLIWTYELVHLHRGYREQPLKSPPVFALVRPTRLPITQPGQRVTRIAKMINTIKSAAPEFDRAHSRISLS